MFHTALQRAGADLGQPCAADAPIELTPEDAEALRQAELEAAFAMFGVKEEQPASDDAEAARMAEIEAAFALFGVKEADQAYRQAYRIADAPAPANETAPAPVIRLPFPRVKARRFHIEPIHALRLIQAIDWVVVAAAAQCAALWGGGGLEHLSLGEAFAFLLGALSLKAGLWLTDAYHVTPATMRAEKGAGGLALGALLGLFVANFIAPDARSAAALAAVVPLAALLLAGIHAALAVWIRAAHRQDAFAETMVLVGATDAACRLAARAAKNHDARIIAIVDDRLARAPLRVCGVPVSGDINALLTWEDLPNVDRIVIAVTPSAETRVREMIERLRPLPNRIDLLLDYPTQSVMGARVAKTTGSAALCVSGRPHNFRRTFVKRTQDIVFAALLALAFAPVMLAIALAVKLDSPGPVLYRQRRHGFNNRIITVLKFRTMRHDPDAPLRQVCANDPRITRIGAFLRRTSLDELPQLFNVLKGDMSLVGPRPHAIGMRAADRELDQIVAEYAHRHRVKPGITGWAQVNGSRGPVETPAALRKRVALDLHYVTHASLWLDLKIMLMTAPALLGDRKATR
ncbi:MAG: exopolysaccharide biosynthesis polyprenyl glycosylphosphotransferase [Hyphomonadaceae bacterium]|nr:exopolysaccharide biosynthesis polyprenyl glycosylphosphotransferase [Hyphomonadaceae bacterium]